MVAVYVLIPILKEIAKNYRLLQYTIGIWIVYLIGNQVLKEEIPQISPLFELNTVIGYAGYFLLGYYLTHIKLTRKIVRIICLLGVMALIWAFCGTYWVSIKKDAPSLDILTNLSANVVVICVFVFVLIKKFFGTNNHKIMEYVSKYTQKDLFGIYLTHAIWLIVLNREPFRSVVNCWITIPLLSITIFVLSLYTTKIIRLIPFLRKVVE